MAVGPNLENDEISLCNMALRSGAGTEATMEDAALRIVALVRDSFRGPGAGRPVLPLVRLYVTRRLHDLEPELQDFARAAGTDTFAVGNPICLTLLATAGEEADWNDRRASRGHKAIPLPSVEALRRAPMIAQLVEQLGIDPRHVIDPDPSLFLDEDDRTHNVFFVSDARNNPYVPAQDNFVVPYGIRSVIGLGGLLPDGSLYALVLFSTLTIAPETIGAYATMRQGVEHNLLPHVGGTTFRRHHPSEAQDAAGPEMVTGLSEVEIDGVPPFVALPTGPDLDLTTVLEISPESIMVMNSDGRIVYANRAAEVMFGYSRAELLAEPLVELIVPETMRDRHRRGFRNAIVTREGPIIGRRIEINALRKTGREFPVELVVQTLAGTDPPLFAGYMRELTAERAASSELVAGRERLAHIAQTLQNSLLPPTLPSIEGFELAATYRAAGAGYDVGGDFYDAFELSHGHWALVLGDVCGKGSEAAVVTALARYTLRAAAMRDPSPTSVLAVLNEAVHRQYPEQFCTVVYAVLDPETGEIQLALGGHPRPLLLDESGARRVGTSSSLLGFAPEWTGTSTEVAIEAGAALLLFSDGVTEARAGKDFFGDDRLAAAFVTTRGESASFAVEAIESTLLDFAGALDDDAAMLMIRRAPEA